MRAMEVFDSFDDIPAGTSVVLAVGVFDGVHLGHQMIIRNAIDDARRLGVSSAVVTFEPHPAEVLSPEPPQRLSSRPIKLKLLSRLEPDLVLRIPFDNEFATMSPDAFIDLLCTKFDLKGIVVGSNFHFGAKGQGTPGRLVEEGNRRGFEVDLVPLLQLDGETVSSTLIRQLVSEGDIHGAKNRLGRPPIFSGNVVPGHQRGRVLGFETANLASPDPGSIPGEGVYAALACIDGDPENAHAAALSIGSQPTFTESGEIYIEVHILDFHGDLYERSLVVEVHARLRDQRKFDSGEELAEQIAADVEQVRTIVLSS